MTQTSTSPPSASDATVADASQVRTRGRAKVPTIMQIEATECGAASLGMILARLGKWVPLEELRLACGVSRDGASALDIVKGARSLGLKDHAQIGDIRILDGLAGPAIIWWRGDHFVVLEQAKAGRFTINDPALGRRKVDATEFFESFSGLALTFTTTENFKKQGGPFRALPSLGRRLRHSRDGLVLATLAGLLVMLFGLAVPLISQVFVDDVLGTSLTRSVTDFLVVTLVLLAILRVALNQLQYRALTRLQVKLALVDTGNLLNHMLRMPMSFYWQRMVGDLANRVSFPSAVAQLLAGQVAGAAISLTSVICYGLLLVWFSPIIALVVITLAAVNVVALRLVLAKRQDGQMRILRDLAEVQGVTIATARSVETLKANGAEGAAFVRWSSAQARSVSAQSSLAGITSGLSSVPTVMAALTAAVILCIGGLQIETGAMTLGTLVAVQAAAMGMNQPIQQLVLTASQIQTITANLRRMDDVLDGELDSRFTTNDGVTVPTKAAKLAGSLELRNVTFGYRTTAEPLIRNFDLHLPAGSRVALVGVSGSGKSTIANLAAGLLQPWSGQVLIDGIALLELEPEILGNSVAKVDQDSSLFEASIRDNITLWDNTIPEDSVLRALADAQVLDEVLARVGGVDGLVLESGRNFSGGQRQRLELARALARDPQLLILDEATSALDPLTEQAVDLALRARGCTCLIVAHRLSTVRDADEIVLLGRNGEVRERGSHSALMRANGAYADLVNASDPGGDIGDR